jgi:hypothetical protein
VTVLVLVKPVARETPQPFLVAARRGLRPIRLREIVLFFAGMGLAFAGLYA